MGRPLHDGGGKRLGRVRGVYADSVSGNPTWLVVGARRPGWLIVPCDPDTVGTDSHVWTPLIAERVQPTERGHQGETLSATEELKLSEHYSRTRRLVELHDGGDPTATSILIAGRSRPEPRPGGPLRWTRSLLGRLDNRMVRAFGFGLVGAFGIPVNLLFLFVFTEWLHVHYLASSFLATQIAIGWNFALLDGIVYRSSDPDRSRVTRLVGFFTLSNAVVIAGYPMLLVLVGMFGVQYLLAALVVIVALAAAKFLAAEFWIWTSDHRRLAAGLATAQELT